MPRVQSPILPHVVAPINSRENVRLCQVGYTHSTLSLLLLLRMATRTVLNSIEKVDVSPRVSFRGV